MKSMEEHCTIVEQSRLLYYHQQHDLSCRAEALVALAKMMNARTSSKLGGGVMQRLLPVLKPLPSYNKNKTGYWIQQLCR